MANITGTSASETLSGTGGNDSIAGLGGNDTINAGTGVDTVDGGDGWQDRLVLSAAASQYTITLVDATHTRFVDAVTGEDVTVSNVEQVMFADGVFSIFELRNFAAGNQAPLFSNTAAGTFIGGAQGFDYANALAVDASGRTYMVGSVANGGDGSLTGGALDPATDIKVWRLNADGTLDTSFGNNGSVVTKDGLVVQARVATLDSNGQLVVGGYAVKNVGQNSFYFTVVRYNTDGTLDTSFDSDGIVNTTIAAKTDQIRAITALPGGKILVDGYTQTGNNSTRDWALIQYNADGTLDTSFGSGGKLVVVAGGTADQSQSVKALADGHILVYGVQTNFSTFAVNAVVAKYDSTGALDTTFGVNGFYVRAMQPDVAATSFTTNMYVEAGGKILIIGYEDSGGGGPSSSVFIERLNANGTLDGSFNAMDGGAGVFLGENGDIAYKVTEQSNGKILIAGVSPQDPSDFVGHGYVMRLNNDGTLDATFGNGGVAWTPFTGGTDNGINDIAVLANDKIVVTGGRGVTTNGYDSFMLRFNSDGTIDTTFNATNSLQGVARYAVGGAPAQLLPSGAIFDAEHFGADSYAGATLTVMRHGGIVGTDSFVGSAALSVSGANIVLGGVTIGTNITVDGGTLSILFNGNATQDRVNGLLHELHWQNGSVVAGATPQFDWSFNDGSGAGNAVVTGTSSVQVVSVTGTGASESIVGTSGNDTITSGGGNDTLVGLGGNDTIVAGNGTQIVDGGTGIDKLVVDDVFSHYTVTLIDADHYRLQNSNTGEDITVTGVEYVQFTDQVATSAQLRTQAAPNIAPVFGYSPAGTVADGLSGGQDGAWRVVQAQDGSTYMVGSGFNQIAEVWHLHADGTLDTAFNPDGARTINVNGAALMSALVDGNGKLVIGMANNVGQFVVARMNADGSMDSGFGGSGIAITQVGGFDQERSMALQGDGKIVVTGYSQNGGGSTREITLVRYNTNGTLDTTFDGDGIAIASLPNSRGTTVQVLSNGDLLLSGTQLSGSHVSLVLQRYLPGGSLDTSFGSGGSVLTPIADNSSAVASRGMAVQGDGKIVVLGMEDSGVGDGSSHMFVLRYNADGSIDSSFNGGGNAGGKVYVPVSTYQDLGRDLQIESDGKIVIAGTSTDANGQVISGFLVRLSTDGSVDTGFGNGGVVTSPFTGGIGGEFLGVREDSNGNLLVASQAAIRDDPSETDAIALRYTHDGQLDTTFNVQNSLAGKSLAGANGPAVDLLWGQGSIFDAKLASRGNYGGSTLTIQRHGGAVAGDIFAFDSDVVQVVGNQVQHNGITLATLTNSGGVLTLHFTSDATQGVASGLPNVITWQNGSVGAGTNVTFDWTFDDGSAAGNAVVTGQSTVNVVAFITGTTGPDDLAAGAGDNSDHAIYGNTGNDTITGHAGDDLLVGDAGNDTIDGGAGNDTILGNAGSDTISGGAGNDNIDGGEITDRINYTDRNVLTYKVGATTGIYADLTRMSDNSVDNDGIVFDGQGGVDHVTNVNFIVGTTFNDTILGSSAPIFEQFEGGQGNDYIDGGALQDSLNNSDSNRANFQNATAPENINLTLQLSDGLGFATGGDGNDKLFNINQVRGSAFADTITGSDRTDYTEQFEGMAGNDTIDGKGGTDIVRYDSSTAAVNVNLATGIASDGFGGTDTLSNIEGVQGSNFSDTLTGGNPNNGVNINDGKFEIFRGGAGNDTIDGGQGYDRADYNTATTGVNVTLGGTGNGTAQDGLGGTDTLINIEAVRGSAFNDTLTGSDTGVFESFEGREGNDVIDGKGGTDRVDYNSSPNGVNVNLLTGTATDGWGSTDSLANIENVRGSKYSDDTIVGSAANNFLEGQGGNDSLSGGAGDDTLNAGTGVDTVDGGTGVDTLVVQGARSAYTITQADSSHLHVVNAATGEDVTASGIEKIQFSDGTRSITNLNTPANIAPVFGYSPAGTIAVDGVPGPDGAWQVVQAPNGSMYMLGNGGNANQVEVWHLNTDGTLDTSYNPDGARTLPLFGAAFVSGFVQADGKLIVGTTALRNGGTGNGEFAVARLNPDGSLDTTFGGTGVVQTPVGTTQDQERVMTVQGDGKIVVTGYSQSGNGTTREITLVRYNIDGSQDSGFGTGGIVVANVPGSRGTAVQVLGNNDLLVVGTQTSGTHVFMVLQRYLPNGTLDSSFGSGGTVLTQIADNSSVVSTRGTGVQADGKIVVLGQEDAGHGDGSTTQFVMRYNVDGSIDTTFNGDGDSDGRVNIPVSLYSDVGRELRIESDGKILIAGTAIKDASGTQIQGFLIRLNADGSYDTGFGNGGVVMSPFGGSIGGEFLGVREDASGNLIVASQDGVHGVDNDASAVALRYLHNGTLDASFNMQNSLAGKSLAGAGGPAVDLLWGQGSIFDAELASRGDYGGSTLTVQRHGGANNGDAFGADSPMLFQGGHVIVLGTDIGTVTSANGTLTIHFNSNATQPYLSGFTNLITWQNAGESAGNTVTFDWAFDDGSGAANAVASGQSSVHVVGMVNGTPGNDALVNGTPSDDAMYGNTGNDSLAGNGGDDLIAGDAGNDTVDGGAGNDTLMGNAGADTMHGGAGNDNIDGGDITDHQNYSDRNTLTYFDSTTGVTIDLRGITDDGGNGFGTVLDGLGGVDTVRNVNWIIGSPNNDTILGSTANIFEQFTPGAGNDFIDGGALHDPLNNNDGNRVVFTPNATAAENINLTTGTATGGDGNDTLVNITQVRGTNLNDTITGSDRTDYTEQFEGLAGNDTIDGKGGFDIVRYDNSTAAVNVNLLTGIATDGFGGTDTLQNIEGVQGSNFNDTLTGGNPANGVNINDGKSEVFRGGGGNDTIDGGQGYDRVDYNTATTGVNVTLGGTGPGTAQDGQGGTDTLLNIEGVRGSVFNDTLTGSDTGVFESFEGREGNDVIDGKGGTDRADYNSSPNGVNVNLLTGVAQDGWGFIDSLANIENVRGSKFSDDTIVGSAANNFLQGQGGNDSIDAGDGNDTVSGGDGNDTLAGGNGFDWVDYSDQQGGVQVNLATGIAIDASVVDPNTGAHGMDSLSGFEGVIGSNFNDSIMGGSGDDQIVGGAGNDAIDGGGGTNNLVAYWDSSVAVNVNLQAHLATRGGETDTLQNIQNVVGSSGNDTLVGDSGDNAINGGLGNDLIDGGAGSNDWSAWYDATAGVNINISAATVGTVLAGMAVGGGNNDTVTGIENITGSSFNDTITGSAGNNALRGELGNDTIDGGAGDDDITGGAGNDSIIGGAGIDTADYFFSNATAGISVTLNAGAGTVTGGDGTDTLSGIENVNATNFNDTITGDANANFLQGEGGNDSIVGGAGNDTIDAGFGVDTVDGGLGTDNDSVVLHSNYGSYTVTVNGTDVRLVNGGTGEDVTVRNVENFQFTDGSKTYAQVTGGVQGDVTLMGTTGNDILAGGSGNDSINGLAGSDTIQGNNGNDTLTGGAGNDSIDGGAGNDWVNYNDAGTTAAVTVNLLTGSATGGAGVDTLAGVENVTGSGFNDSITGNAQDNSLFGGVGNDTIIGGDGNDFIQGGAGNDSLTGGNGIDTADFGDATAAVNVNLVTGKSTGGSGADTLATIENVNGSNFNDTLVGDDSGGGNFLQGGAGNDLIQGGGGWDGAGYYGATTSVNVNLATGIATDGQGGTDTLSGIEQVDGSRFNDTLVGDANSNSLVGNDGDDFMDGGPGGGNMVGYWTATGGVSVNLANGTATGAAGNDTFVNIQNIGGSNFADTLVGDANNNYIEGRGGNDFIDAGGGTDTVSYQQLGGTTGVNVNLVSCSVSGGSNDTLLGVENIIGTNFDDTIVGTSGDNNFTGGQGNDSIVGGGGNDWVNYNDASNGTAGVSVNLVTGAVTGGSGNDTLSAITNVDASNNNDTLAGDANNNVLRGEAGNDSISGNDGNDYITGGAGNDTIVGGNGIDTADYFFSNATAGVNVNLATGSVTGGDGNDSLSGIENVNATNFNDTITGDANNNFIQGEAGNDSIVGGAGNDTLQGNDGNDTLAGGLGSDNLQGGAGDDSIAGNEGNDVVDGGAGNDTMDGGVVTDHINYVDLNRLSYQSSTGPVSVNMSGVTGDGSTGVGTASDGMGGTDTISNFNNFTLSQNNDMIVGSSARILELFEGLGGDDTIDGGAITDTLNGTNINRVVYVNSTAGVTVDLQTGGINHGSASGGEGNDTLLNINQVRGSNFGDILNGSDRTDVNESFEGMGGDDTIDGRGGFDLVRYGLATAGVQVNLVTGTATGGAGNDHFVNIEGVSGSNFNDTLLGGNSANDALETFRGDGGNDTIDGGSGYDRVDYNLATSGANVTLGGTGVGTAQDGVGGTDTLTNIEAVRGSDFNDTLTGSDSGAFESFEGMTGNDIIDGKGGEDRVDYQTSTSGVNVNLTTNSAQDGWGGTDSLANIEDVRGSRDFNDTITGSAAANKIESLGGNDSILGMDGDDTLDAGTGVDTVDGGNGTDTLVVKGALADYIVTRPVSSDTVLVDIATGENITMRGVEQVQFSDGLQSLAVVQGNSLSPFDDSYVGTDGPDSIDGLAGNDTLSGLGGNDTINGNVGNDSMIGGTGDDLYIVDSLGDKVVENSGEGNDTVNVAFTTTGQTFTLSANVENAVVVSGSTIVVNVVGNELDNQITGNAAANNLQGGAGNDTIDGGVGNDTMAGGAGDDTYVVNVATDAVNETAPGSGGNDTVLVAFAANGTYVMTPNVENAVVTNGFNVNVTGSADNNVITGGAGNNVLLGMDGDDTLVSSTGADTLDGGNGNDTIVVMGARAAYTVTHVNATDTTLVNAGTGENIVMRNAEAVQFTDGLKTMTDLWGNTPSALPDSLVGTSGNDTIDGLAGNDTIQGLAGDDSLIGGAGIDSLIGGLGNDTYSVDNAADVIVENADEGTDAVNVAFIAAGSFNMLLNAANVENATVTSTGTLAVGIIGNALDNFLKGNAAVNNLQGGDGNDTLDGGAGKDSMSGGAGNDVYVLDVATDVVNESVAGSSGTDTVNLMFTVGGTYTLTAGVENGVVANGTSGVNITGNALANVLTGNAGANTLLGGAGNDTIYGGGGNDVVDGGTEVDTLILTGIVSDYTITRPTATTVMFSKAGATVTATNIEFVQFDNQTVTITSLTSAVGSPLADTLIGGDGNDTFDGAAGNDFVSGQGGDDLLFGGTGADTLTGGTGNDILDGGDGSDQYIFNQGDGDDLIVQNDTITTDLDVLKLMQPGLTRGQVTFSRGDQTYNDLVVSIQNGTGDAATFEKIVIVNFFTNDSVSLGTIDQVQIIASPTSTITITQSDIKAAVLTPGDGSHVFVGYDSADSITGNDNGDWISAGANNDTVTGGAGDDTIFGGSGNDSLVGGGGNDLIIGGAGADTLVGGAGDDSLSGGGGGDTYVFSKGDGHDMISEPIFALGDNDLESGIGPIYAVGDGDFPLGAETDVIAFGANVAEADVHASRMDNDLVLTIVSSNGDDSVTVENYFANTVSAIERVNFSSGSVWTSTQIKAKVLVPTSGDDSIVGYLSADKLNGGAGDDTIDGREGNDTINGGAGADVLTGGKGNDKFVFDATFDGQADTITDFLSGADTIMLSNAVFGGLGSVGQRIGLSDHLTYDNVSGNLVYDADGAGGNDGVVVAIMGTETHPLTLGNDFVITA